MTWVAGVDGCRGGWLAALMDITGAQPPQLMLHTTFESIVRLPEAPIVIAVDMPIGLPDRSTGSGRACEVAVRARLGARQSSIFSTPSRAAVMESNYRQACTTAFSTSTPPRRVSKQAFNLFPRIREIDALLRIQAELRGRVFEVHPEASFCLMNGGAPATLPKKIKGRTNPPGLAERRRLLLASDIPPALVDWFPLPRGVGGDDLLDACACLWTAVRILAGTAECHPPNPPRDAFGLEMAIRA